MEEDNLLSIEPFLWSKICTYLRPRDVINLSSTCQTLWGFLDVEHAGAVKSLQREYHFAQLYNVARILNGRVSFPSF